MFTHLHVHTEYSLLDGMCRIPQLIKKAKEMGMTALAITDHGSMHGVIDFYLEAKKAGIKPIIGCEVYVAPLGRHTKNAAHKSPNHLLLLAKDITGYRNLLHLVTLSNTEGFYYKPRVDKELLAQYKDGLVALSACMKGEIASLIEEGRLDEAEKTALWYKENFGEFYLELQSHDIPRLEHINKELIAMSKRLHLPLVVTNDVHYTNQSESEAHDVLLCIQTNAMVYEEKRMRMADNSFYLKSQQEMAALFPDLTEAVENTMHIADSCNLEIEFGRLLLPDYNTPRGQTPHEFLAELCWEGVKKRYDPVTTAIEQRLTYELDVIERTKFANYFLVVWDLAFFVREKNILFGVRGSAAASIVLYCLGITNIDPLEGNLIFERFLNIERKEMPDIDLDFQDDRRAEVISYVMHKYGNDHVAQIITFGTLGARASIRDVGRALGFAYSEVDKVARLIPTTLNITIDKAFEGSNELQSAYNSDESIKKLVDTAKKLEGVARHASTHAAGVVISKESLIKHVPLQKPTRSGNDDEILMTQFAMENIAQIGLLKMDFLGLSNLTILGKAKEIIKQTSGIDIDLHHLPLNDKKTYDLLSAGETTGVFQLESSGMRRYIEQLKPTVFSDIAAMVALYRPGPMQHIPTFIKSKHGEEAIKYPHQALAQILEQTYGVIVFQDQVLLIVQAFGGYSLGQADIVRKAMGKKIPEVMKKERQRFQDGAITKGYTLEIAEKIFDLIEPFAGYAFNKAHSWSYALIAYQTAYLKANYPAEFMAALFTVCMGQAEKTAAFVSECQRIGIKVKLPDINYSEEAFTVEDNGKAIRFSLAAIKNVGLMAIRPIIEARKKDGPFTSIADLCRRADIKGINKRTLESMIKAGALDSIGNRGALLAIIDRIISVAQREQKLKDMGQSTMFDIFGGSVAVPVENIEMPDIELDLKDKLAWEKEMVGAYISEHPFSVVAKQLALDVDVVLCGQITEEMAGKNVRTAGQVISARPSFTKDKRPFITATIEDLQGYIEVMAWSDIYEKTKDLWVEGKILLIEGKVRMRNDRPQLNCFKAQEYEIREKQEKVEKNGPVLVPVQNSKEVIIRIKDSGDPNNDIALLKKVIGILKQYPGADEIRFFIDGNNLKFPGLTVQYTDELHRQVGELIGEYAIYIQNKVI